jgi:sulfite reductase beta subunit-like hemoprotein
VGEAIVRMFHRLGNRENRHRARLKYVLRKLGRDAFVATYRQLRAEVDAEALSELALGEKPERTVAPPVLDDGPPMPGLLSWKAQAIGSRRARSGAFGAGR